ERDIQEEDGAPTDVLDEPAAEDGSDRRRDGAETRPRADRASAFCVTERRADDREAPRHEKGRARTLHRACDDEHARRRRETARDRGRREEQHTAKEYAL